MQVVACPHCSAQVANYGTLAGQVVSCHHCRQHFQMPPLQPPAATSTFDLGEEPEEPARRPKRRRRSSGGTWAAVGCSLLILAVLGVFALGLAWVRRLGYLAHFAMLTLSWALLTGRFWLTDVPLAKIAQAVFRAGRRTTQLPP